MSTTGTYASKATRAPAVARHGNALVAAVIIGLFVVAAGLSALRKDITQGFDELAHTSYVAHIQATGDAWPALDRMRLLDPKTFQFTDATNYLNHPPMFYALLAAAGPRLEGRPPALLAHRLIDIGIVAFGLAALLALGCAAHFGREEFYAYALPVACIPALAPLAGSVNNDDLAFLGGAVATFGVWQLAATARGGWLAVALLGVIVASWAKLTGLLLSAVMLAAAVSYLVWRRRIPWSWTIAVALAVALAAAPYAIYLLQYGSVTPETPAQLALLADGSRTAGWTDSPRRSFIAYLGWFVVAFVADWMPALAPRSGFNYAMLAIPVAALGCALAGIALSLRRLRLRQECARDIVVIAGTMALTATFVLHVTYSYGRHIATGWLMDAYPRYYLPLAAIVPLAGLSLLAAVETPRWRAALLGFLIGGPVIFRIFGAPLG